MSVSDLSRRLICLMVVLLLIGGASDLVAKKRTSGDVRRDRQKTEKEIARTKKQIAANDRETGRQLDRLASIKAEIALHADTIALLSARLDSVNAEIARMDDSIAVLENREATIRADYARTLRTMRSRRQSMSDLSFLFSSPSFSQAWKRVGYLQKIANAASQQAKLLASAKEDVALVRNTLDSLRISQADAISRQNEVRTSLRAEQASADNLVKNLKKQGKSLQRELDRRNRQAKALAAELDKVVEREIREAEERRRKEAEEKARAEAEARRQAEEKARREAQAKEAAKKKEAGKQSPSASQSAPANSPTSPTKPAADVKTTTPPPKPPTFESEAEKDRRLTGSFESNKGKLLFPVAGRYTIVSSFGTNELPELSKVKVDNLGIDIEVPKGSDARSVFEGVVSSIFRLDGFNNVVIVRHGEYLSVYAGIDSLAVKKGDKVKAGQRLGRVAPQPGSEAAKLHFEIRRERQKLNPVEWVK